MSSVDRPEHVDFLIGIAHVAKADTEYQVSFRAWQLKELRDYIKTLEENQK